MSEQYPQTIQSLTKEDYANLGLLAFIAEKRGIPIATIDSNGEPIDNLSPLRSNNRQVVEDF